MILENHYDLANLRLCLLASSLHRPDDRHMPANQSRQKPITRPAGSDEGFIVSEVRRTLTWFPNELGGSMLEDVVRASDYDAAQSELSALREENERMKSESFEELYNAAIDERDALLGEVATAKHDIASFLETTAKVCALLGIDTEDAKHAEGKPSDVLFSHATAMQQRLTAAEQRNAELADIADELLTAYESTIHSAYCQVNPDNDLISKAIAALKPTESGASE
jgi:hypothetical protein